MVVLKQECVSFNAIDAISPNVLRDMSGCKVAASCCNTSEAEEPLPIAAAAMGRCCLSQRLQSLGRCYGTAQLPASPAQWFVQLASAMVIRKTAQALHFWKLSFNLEATEDCATYVLLDEEYC